MISGYRVEKKLGEGGVGIVYKAVRQSDGLPVAIKMIRPAGAVTATALTKFILEAEIVRRLDHPGIVKFVDSGVAAGKVWFAMEFVSGANAAETAVLTGRLDVSRAVGWIVQSLEALALLRSILATIRTDLSAP